MDTLKRIIDDVLRPQGMLNKTVWSHSTATFQGITPTPEHSLGLVTFPIGLPGLPNAQYCADVIGGNSTLCPGLVPLRTLMSLHAVLMCNWYDSGDGILGLWYKGDWVPQHLYKTDSGHYLLRIDQYGHAKGISSGVVLKTANQVSKWAGKSDKWSTSGPTLHAQSWYGTSNQGAWTAESKQDFR